MVLTKMVSVYLYVDGVGGGGGGGGSWNWFVRFHGELSEAA